MALITRVLMQKVFWKNLHLVIFDQAFTKIFAIEKSKINQTLYF